MTNSTSTSSPANARCGSALSIIESPGWELWNSYLQSRGPGQVFHRAEWDRVFTVYRLPILRLAALRDGRIVGVLPLAWQRSFLSGNQLVSLPWFDTAGVVANDDEAHDALVAAARVAATARGARIVQLRGTDPPAAHVPVRTDKVLLRRKLESNPEALWESLSAKVRNQVRKGQKSGLTVERGGRELLPEFFAVYSTNMRDLGSPSHHFRLFHAVLDAFGDIARVYVVRHSGQAVGAGLTVSNGSVLEIPWASSLRKFNTLCVNHVMYWELLADACRCGFQFFHFGRSTRDSGTWHFKKQWGAEEVQLYWQFIVPDGQPVPDLGTPQESYGWGIRLWQRMPLWLTRNLGPRIIANIP